MNSSIEQCIALLRLKGFLFSEIGFLFGVDYFASPFLCQKRWLSPLLFYRCIKIGHGSLQCNILSIFILVSYHMLACVIVFEGVIVFGLSLAVISGLKSGLSTFLNWWCKILNFFSGIFAIGFVVVFFQRFPFGRSFSNLLRNNNLEAEHVMLRIDALVESVVVIILVHRLPLFLILNCVRVTLAVIESRNTAEGRKTIVVLAVFVLKALPPVSIGVR